MDLKELNSFKMSDAVTFHDNLNSKLFRGQHLQPEVELQLKNIAQDFLQEMGIHDLDVRDITVSGSNAAYSYTDHSDLDLHILVNMKDLPDDDIYREFFKAKKDLYNDSHDITINGIPVELYIQDAAEPVTSLGEYSVKDKKWLRLPTKRRANFDQTATKAKYEKLLDIIDTALHSDNMSKVNKILKKITQYRQAGLDKGGEFGPENLAYKALRSRGYITKLYDLRDKLHSKHLSLNGMYSNVSESFDKPYKVLRWEKGDFGDVDAIARLDDGTFLSIMFTKGFSQETQEDAWSVEFYRNNSQEVTGEGDAQRVFATVLSAIQTFIKKYKPNKVFFAANKVDDTGHDLQSRASLYDKLVQRYAKSWGFRAFRADTGNKVMYELSRIKKDIAEESFDGMEISLEKDNDEIMVRATANGKELGQVLFVEENGYLLPQDLEVDERYRGQGIASTMYNYVKSQGYNIRRSGQQTDAGAGFWDKHRPEQNVWEASGYIPSEKQKNDPHFSTALTVDIKPDSIKKNAKAFYWNTSRAGIPPTAKPSGKI